MTSLRVRIDGREGRLAQVLAETPSPGAWILQALLEYVALNPDLDQKERSYRVTLREGRDDAAIGLVRVLQAKEESVARLVRAACAYKLGRLATLDPYQVAQEVAACLQVESFSAKTPVEQGDVKQVDDFCAQLLGG